MNAYEFTACITAIGPKYDDDDAAIRIQVRELEERANLAPGKVFIARNACKLSRFASEIAVGYAHAGVRRIAPCRAAITRRANSGR